MPLTRQDLDQMGCGSPGCHHDHSQVFIHAKCHPSRPVEALYDKASGCLLFRCQKCHSPVAAIQVAATTAYMEKPQTN